MELTHGVFLNEFLQNDLVFAVDNSLANILEIVKMKDQLIILMKVLVS